MMNCDECQYCDEWTNKHPFCEFYNEYLHNIEDCNKFKPFFGDNEEKALKYLKEEILKDYTFNIIYETYVGWSKVNYNYRIFIELFDDIDVQLLNLDKLNQFNLKSICIIIYNLANEFIEKIY